MSGKRIASSDLNYDNWDQDEEPEEAGTFQKASEESLQRRIIKTARRRNPISSVRCLDLDKKSPFTCFTAFSKTLTPITSQFTFLSNVTNSTEQQQINGRAESIEKSVLGKVTSNLSYTKSNKISPIFSSTVHTNIPKDTNRKSNDYFSKLKGLNESVSNWIKKHVDSNPLIDLQPIFKDYEKYFKELEKDDSESIKMNEVENVDMNKKDENISLMDTFVFKTTENVPDNTTVKKHIELNNACTNKNNYPFGLNSAITNKLSSGFGNTSTSNTFSFASSNISTLTMSTLSSSSSLGSNASSPHSTSVQTGLSFSGSVPFTFTSVTQPSIEELNEEKGVEDDDEPPKVEFTPVVEKDHIYTTRCKVFVKKDGSYRDRGVGNLYLKLIENSKKFQLIVRADTNLGNLLCNFILSENIPTKRMGKKDVMLVCLPTPDHKPPPVAILLRVKSSEEANNLLEILEKYKK